MTRIPGCCVTRRLLYFLFGTVITILPCCGQMWPGLVHAWSEFLDQLAIRGVTLHGTIYHPPRTTRTEPTPRRRRRIPSFLLSGRQMVAANQSLAMAGGGGTERGCGKMVVAPRGSRLRTEASARRQQSVRLHPPMQDTVYEQSVYGAALLVHARIARLRKSPRVACI